MGILQWRLRISSANLGICWIRFVNAWGKKVPKALIFAKHNNMRSIRRHHHRHHHPPLIYVSSTLFLRLNRFVISQMDMMIHNPITRQCCRLCPMTRCVCVYICVCVVVCLCVCRTSLISPSSARRCWRSASRMAAHSLFETRAQSRSWSIIWRLKVLNLKMMQSKNFKKWLQLLWRNSFSRNCIHCRHLYPKHDAVFINLWQKDHLTSPPTISYPHLHLHLHPHLQLSSASRLPSPSPPPQYRHGDLPFRVRPQLSGHLPTVLLDLSRSKWQSFRFISKTTCKSLHEQYVLELTQSSISIPIIHCHRHVPSLVSTPQSYRLHRSVAVVECCTADSAGWRSYWGRATQWSLQQRWVVIFKRDQCDQWWQCRLYEVFSTCTTNQRSAQVVRANQWKLTCTHTHTHYAHYTRNQSIWSGFMRL